MGIFLQVKGGNLLYGMNRARLEKFVIGRKKVDELWMWNVLLIYSELSGILRACLCLHVCQKKHVL